MSMFPYYYDIDYLRFLEEEKGDSIFLVRVKNVEDNVTSDFFVENVCFYEKKPLEGYFLEQKFSKGFLNNFESVFGVVYKLYINARKFSVEEIDDKTLFEVNGSFFKGELKGHIIYRGSPLYYQFILEPTDIEEFSLFIRMNGS